MTTTGKTDSATGAMPFPVIQDGIIGTQAVQTVNARDVHTYLKVGKDFSNWMRDRISTFGFVEHLDYEVFAEIGENPSGGRPAKEYAISLDMAKELGMVDRSEQGRTIRQYFLACERMLKAEVQRQADIEARVDRRVNALLAERSLMVRYGKTAGQVLRESGFPPVKGLAGWFGNRLVKLGYSIEGEGRADHGDRAVRIFDPDKVGVWLRAGGRVTVDQKIAERRGQKKIRLVAPLSEDARTY